MRSQFTSDLCWILFRSVYLKTPLCKCMTSAGDIESAGRMLNVLHVSTLVNPFLRLASLLDLYHDIFSLST